MIFCLPLLFADDRFTSLDRITVRKLEKFIPFMVSCSVGREKPLGYFKPLWWPSDLPFSIPLKKPHSVRKKWSALLKSLVCRCYSYHGCEFMLRFCTDLANTPNSALAYVDTWYDTVSVYSKKTGKLVVTVRSENMTYDKTPQIARPHIFEKNSTYNECDNTYCLDIYVCEMCDFTFPNLKALQKHEEMCRLESASVTVHNEAEPLASEQERFLDYLGLSSSANLESTVQQKNMSNDVRWKHAGENFTRCCSIPVSSPLGLALHRRTKPSTVSSEVHLGKVERHCVTVLPPPIHEDRQFDGTWRTTWKLKKKSTKVSGHIYKFPRKHMRCRPPVPYTGLTSKSLKPQLRKPGSFVLQMFEREDIIFWPKKNNVENLNRDMEVKIEKIDSTSANIVNNYSTSLGEKAIIDSYLKSFNSHYHPHGTYAHNDARKQLLCQTECADMELHSECTENIVPATGAYTTDFKETEWFSGFSDAVSAPERQFIQNAEGLMQISTSPNVGSVWSSPESFFPQSVASVLSSETDASVVDATDFSLSQEIVSSNDLTQCDLSPLYIPEAQTMDFNPLHPQTISEICTPPCQVHSSILNPLLPLTAAPSGICTAGTHESFVESESIVCKYPADIYSSLSENVFPKHERSGFLYAEPRSKPSEEQLKIQKQMQEKNILLATSNLNDTLGVCSRKDASVSCTGEEIDMLLNIKQDHLHPVDQYTPLRSRSNVSLNTEFQDLPCTSTLCERNTVAAASNPAFSAERGFRSKLMPSNDPVYNSVTNANTSCSKSGYIVQDNKTYHNCLETSDVQCLHFKSTPSLTSECARNSIENSLKTITNKFPRGRNTAAIKINKNVEKLSREVQKPMKYECIKQDHLHPVDQYTPLRSRSNVSLNTEFQDLPCTSTLCERNTVAAASNPAFSAERGFRSKLMPSNDPVYNSVTNANTSCSKSGYIVQDNKTYHNCLETSDVQCLHFKSTPSLTSECARNSIENSLKTITNKFPRGHNTAAIKINKKVVKLSREVQKPMKDECGSSGTQPSENFSSSYKIRIFTKSHAVNQKQKKKVSRELKRLLQDECKELVNLGLERCSVPVKTSEKASTFENILIAELREMEEVHREWFKTKDVMCVINFPYEF